MQIFYHDIRHGAFDKVEDAKWSEDPTRYSLLSSLSREHRDKDGKFTFALLYPELKIHNIWQQSENPINIQDPYSDNIHHFNVSGYNPIDIKADRNEKYCIWGGLLLSETTVSLLDGCPGGYNWYFSIGYNGQASDYPNAIPSNNKPVKIVSLWVKVSDTCAPFYKSYCSTNFYIDFRLLVAVFIYIYD